MSKSKSNEPVSSKDGNHIDAFKYEDVDHIKIDFSLIPDHVRDDLAKTVWESVRDFLRQPGGREKMDALIAKIEKREAAKRTAK